MIYNMKKRFGLGYYYQKNVMWVYCMKKILKKVN